MNSSVAVRNPVTSPDGVHEQRLALQLSLGEKDEAHPDMMRKKKTDSRRSSIFIIGQPFWRQGEPEEKEFRRQSSSGVGLIQNVRPSDPNTRSRILFRSLLGGNWIQW